MMRLHNTDYDSSNHKPFKSQNSILTTESVLQSHKYWTSQSRIRKQPHLFGGAEALLCSSGSDGSYCKDQHTYILYYRSAMYGSRSRSQCHRSGINFVARIRTSCKYAKLTLVVTITCSSQGCPGFALTNCSSKKHQLQQQSYLTSYEQMLKGNRVALGYYWFWVTKHKIKIKI
jgi:hypothetical protein